MLISTQPSTSLKSHPTLQTLCVHNVIHALAVTHHYQHHQYCIMGRERHPIEGLYIINTTRQWHPKYKLHNSDLPSIMTTLTASEIWSLLSGLKQCICMYHQVSSVGRLSRRNVFETWGLYCGRTNALVLNMVSKLKYLQHMQAETQSNCQRHTARLE